MKWGLLFASTGVPDPVGAVALGQASEAAGFESLWAPEHVVVSRSSTVGYNENDHFHRLTIAVRARSGDDLREELGRCGSKVTEAKRQS